MGKKGRGMWESMLEGGPRAGILKRILGGEMRTKWEVRGIEGNAGGKGSKEMWSETQAKKQLLAVK